MKLLTSAIAAAAVISASTALPSPAPASDAAVELNKPLHGSTMFFADRFATAYYLVDEENYRTVVTIGPGPDGKGNPMQLVNSLSDGESAKFSVGGYGENAVKVTLQLHRVGDTVKANVTTETQEPNS